MSTEFIQLHALTAYPPANLNRDDLGRPKTAIFGGRQRLRISSQCLKRTWRTSPVFAQALTGHVGTRTKDMGLRIDARLREAGVDDKDAIAWAASIAGQFGKSKSAPKANPRAALEIEQLAHFSPEEIEAIDELTDVLASEKRPPTDEELQLLRNDHQAADIGMFGRMIAAAPKYNTDAAVQVAHAITVHQADVEDDYFSAVDDLNTGEEDAGAAHIGELGFGAGLFYLYVCVDRGQLRDNLQGDDELVSKALKALTEAVTTVAPSGKQNSFASRAYANYALAERGPNQPRSLAHSFIDPVRGRDPLKTAIARLEETRGNMAQVYGETWRSEASFNAVTGEGSLESLLAFVSAEGRHE